MRQLVGIGDDLVRLEKASRADEPKGVVRDRDSFGIQAGCLELLRNEVLARDPELLLFRVAGELDDVHPVEQRSRNRLELVRGADEQHLREVERKVEIVVAERLVLLGVEHLEHRAPRIAAEIGAHLVDLVDQHHRVHRLRVADRADDRPGHCADVREPVTADLRLVPHAADRQALELPSERACDRMPERRLADAGRPDEAEDLTRDLVPQLRNRQVLDDPVLDLLEVEVILVEHPPRVVEIEVVVRERAPRQADEPIDVRTDDAVLRGGGRKLLEPRQLTVDGLANVLRQLHLVEARAQLVDLGLLGVTFAELVLDRLQLLAQEELALPLLHFLLDLRLDLGAELEDLELAVQDCRHLAEPRLHVGELEQVLLLLGLEAQRRGDEIAERARVVDVRSGDLQLLGEIRDEADDAREQRLHVPR